MKAAFNEPSPFLAILLAAGLWVFFWQKELLVKQSCRDQASLSELS